MTKQPTELKTLTRVILIFAYFIFWVFASKAIAGDNDPVKKINKTAVHFTRHVSGNILVEIKAMGNKNIDLYIFDTEGILIKKITTAPIKADHLFTLNNGQYIYQCFENDAQLKTGKLFVNPQQINYD
jgi:hypothetical protein